MSTAAAAATAPPVKPKNTKKAGGGRKKKPKKNEDFDDDLDFGDDGSDSISGADSDSDMIEKRKNASLIEEQDDSAVPDVDKTFQVGRLLFCGGTDWDMIGRKELPKSAKTAAAAGGAVHTGPKSLWGVHAWAKDIRVKGVFSSCVACHSVIITEDGQALSWGRNDKGQLGHGDMITKYEPTPITSPSGVKWIGAACGRGHTLLLTSKGVVYSCGDNKCQQLGIDSKDANVLTPRRVIYRGKPIIKMTCGAEFSIILDVTGALYSFGSPEFGQLGHGEEGKFLEKAGKVTFKYERVPRRINNFIAKGRGGEVTPFRGVVILDVASGVCHTVALDNQNRVFTWGFAGYGRLGHSETKNELIPRSISNFDYIKTQILHVAAGSTFCLATCANKMTYFWGQNKPAGEATMYPKPLQDLQGWNVRSIGCANKSIVVAADESLISWGPSPTYGELGYGENRAKSSTVPQEVKDMVGLHVHEVSCGFAHALMVVRDESDEEKAKMEKLPKWPYA